MIPPALPFIIFGAVALSACSLFSSESKPQTPSSSGDDPPTPKMLQKHLEMGRDLLAQEKPPVFSLFQEVKWFRGPHWPYGQTFQDTPEAQEVDSLLYERLLQRAVEEAEAYSSGKKTCDLKASFDSSQDPLATEKLPCNRTYLTHLNAVLKNIARAERAEKLLGETTHSGNTTCHKEYWAGGNQPQVVSALEGLTQFLGAHTYLCSTFTVTQIHTDFKVIETSREWKVIENKVEMKTTPSSSAAPPSSAVPQNSQNPERKE